jgi:hypothetical protein
MPDLQATENTGTCCKRQQLLAAGSSTLVEEESNVAPFIMKRWRSG